MEKIKINLYGVLAEIAGSTEIVLSQVSDLNSLKINLEMNFPEIKEYNYLIAVNNSIVAENKILKDGDSVAVMPPFSGG